MVLKRREAKDHGTKKMVEGLFNEGEICLIVEDVVTSGASVLETYESLKDVKLNVTDAVVLLDRQQGGKENLNKKGINLHSVFTITSLIQELLKSSRLNEGTAQSVFSFIEMNRLDKKSELSVQIQGQSLKERYELMEHPVSKKLIEIILSKKSNLCLAVDVTEAKKWLQIADEIGPYICCLKTHMDIVDNFSIEFINKLKVLSAKHKFLLFEDRKFSDIGNTVEHQFASGTFQINDWADLITIHALSGPGILQALSKVNKKSGFVLVAEMSSQGSLITSDYTNMCVKIGEQCKDVIGFVCQHKLSTQPHFIHMTPGVNLKKTRDFGDQRYRSPTDAIKTGGIDLIIVGRGILDAENPVVEARLYQKEGFEAYLQCAGTMPDLF